MSDLRHALRQLAKSPGFTVVAVLSLAIGIGINSTIFSAMDAAFLRPLPVRQSDELVRFEWPRVTFPEYEQLNGGFTTLSSLIASSRTNLLLQGPERLEPVTARVVSANYFSTLDPGPAAAGTLFSPTHPQRRESIVVISHAFWLRRFAGDAAIVGQTITLNQMPATVVGVAPAGFTGEARLPPTDLWCPAGSPLDRTGKQRSFELTGRLAPGVTAEQTQAEARSVFARAEWSSIKPIRGERVLVWSEQQSRMDHGGRLTYLMGPIVGLVLLVACANVSCLLLGRYEERRREIAVRLALGASRFRVLRYLLAEGLLLSLAGAALGLLFSRWSLDFLPSLLPPAFATWAPVMPLDHRVLGLTLGLALAATLAFGLVPAWRASELDVSTMLKTDTVRLGRTLGRNVLVVAQVTIAMVFLATSALFVRGFLSGLNQDLGFTERRVLMAHVFPEQRTRIELIPLLDELRQTVSRLPGVRAVSLANTALGGRPYQLLTPEDEKTGNAAGQPMTCNAVDYDYFSTLGIAVLQGREFSAHDTRSGARVAIVSESLAKLLWPDGNPVGRTLFAGDPRLQSREVVGVVRDLSLWGERIMTRPMLYLPLRQEAKGNIALVIQTSTEPGALAGPLRRALKRMETSADAVMIETLSSRVRLALMPQWFAAWLGGVLGLLAFLLAVSGLYSVVAYSVTRRTRELGIRIAMGASPRDAVHLVLREGALLALVGVALGLPAAIGVGVVARSGLFGISPTDPLALLGSALLVIAVAVLASWLPARRATRVNPVDALRAE